MTSGGSSPGGTLAPRALEIRLTEQETKICEVLDAVAKRYQEREGKPVQLRIAGGWVRDKLLGLSCHDLDIGIDTMMGYDFAALVNEYMESIGQEKRSIAKIATNPEKSKHLETATMVVLGMPLDFVNLRSEVYDDASRIPSEITFGTPSEDAYRRDITINALFYNIHTRSVEDFTGRGLEDLKNGIVRTPLEAYETFWQDPLRVMRCIRFAARFHFKIAEDSKQAILDERIKQALKTKISKERIGAELDKMIDDGAGRSAAIRLIHELGLYDVVFAPPVADGTVKGTTGVQGQICDVEDAFKLVWIMEWLLKINPSRANSSEDSEGTIFQAEVDQGQELLLAQTRGTPFTTHLYPLITTTLSPKVPHIASKEEPFPEKLGTRNLILSAMLYPYRNMTAIVNKKPVPAGSWILRYGLKGKNLDIDIVTKLMDSVEAVRATVKTLAQFSATNDEESIKDERAKMGMLIRDIGFIAVIGRKWPCAFMLALGVDLLPKFEALRAGVLDQDVQARIATYNKFLSKAVDYQIDQCFSWKYLVDGKELTQLLNIKPGPKITEYLQSLDDLRNKEMITVDNYPDHGATTSSPFRYATKLHRRIHSDSQAILHIVKGHAKAVMAAASTLTSSPSSAKLASGVSGAAVEGYERREADQCVWYTIRVYPCPITVRGNASMPILRKSYSVYRRYEDVVEFAERLEAERAFFKVKHDAFYLVRRLLHPTKGKSSNATPPPWSPVNDFGTDADCMRRKRNLDIYLQELFKLGPTIGQCRLATEFFGMWKTDFETDLLPALHSLVTKPCQMSKGNEPLSPPQAQHETPLELPKSFSCTPYLSLSASSSDSTTRRFSPTSTLDTSPPKAHSVWESQQVRVCERPSGTPSLADCVMAQDAVYLPSPPGSSYHSDDEDGDFDEDKDDFDWDDNDKHESGSSTEHMNSSRPSIDSEDEILNSDLTDLKTQIPVRPLWQTYEPETPRPAIGRRRNAVHYERIEDAVGPITSPLTPLFANVLRLSPSCDVEGSPCLGSKIHRESKEPLRLPIHAFVPKKIASLPSRCPTPVSLSKPGQVLCSAAHGAGDPNRTSAGHPPIMPDRIKPQDKRRPLTRSIKRRKRVSGPRPTLSPIASKPPPGILKNWTRTIKETRLTCQTSPSPPRPRGEEHEPMKAYPRMASPTPGAQFLSKYPKAFAAVFKIVVDPDQILALQVMEKDEDFVLSVPDLRLRVRQKFERAEMPLPNDFELLASIALFGVAIFSFATDSQILLESHMLSWVTVILSGIVFLISILGCASAVSDIKRVIGTYGVLLSVLIVIQLFFLIYALTRHDQVDSILDKAWQKAYDNQPQTLQDLETRLHCCGYETVTDRAIPKTSKYACRDSPAFGYQTACKEQLKDAYSRHESAFLGVIAGIEVLQL
ncbi:CCA tRNA nucleotidyltransferase, mitochondrial [Mortierella alpina]|nr:CCA tRNA nucleotidyltransferase, mitochondrial [Mortierella alpina]